MSKKKLCDRDILTEFKNMLLDIYNRCNELRYEISGLIEYYDKYILETKKEEYNEIKRKFYFDIKNAKNEDEKKKSYEIYKQFKEIVKELEKYD